MNALLSSMRQSLTAGLSRKGARSMGRPKKPASERKSKLSIALQKPLLKDLEQLAKEEHRSLSSLIEAAMSDFVKVRKSTKKT